MSFNSHNTGNFHPNERNKISKSKLGFPFIQYKEHFRNQTKGFCSIVDQTQDLFGTSSRTKCLIDFTFLALNKVGANQDFETKIKSFHFILAQSGNSMITTACPLKSGRKEHN